MSSPDPDQVLRDWRFGEDVERAVVGAKALLRDIVQADQPMSVKLHNLTAAAEGILDAPGGDPMLLVRAANSLAKEQQHRELTTRLTSEERLRARLIITEARIRGLHCADRSDLAFLHCMAAWTAIENFAGGRDALLASLGHRPPTVVGEFVTQSAGRFAAVLKRARRVDDRVRIYWTKELRAVVDSYIPDLDAERAFVYPGTPTLVQVLFLLAETRDPEDRKRINALRQLDQRARLTDLRAQATIPLREAAIARFEGDVSAFEKHSRKGLAKLEDRGLFRHLRVARSRGYLRADETD